MLTNQSMPEFLVSSNYIILLKTDNLKKLSTAICFFLLFLFTEISQE
jgi:hypothetical protein